MQAAAAEVAAVAEAQDIALPFIERRRTQHSSRRRYWH